MSGPRFPDAQGREVPSPTRAWVEGFDGRLCQYCGADGPTLDHVYPWIQGGTHDRRNLVCACQVCNSIAGLRVFAEFAPKREYVLARRAQLGYLRLSRLAALAAAGRQIGAYT